MEIVGGWNASLVFVFVEVVKVTSFRAMVVSVSTVMVYHETTTVIWDSGKTSSTIEHAIVCHLFRHMNKM